MALSQTAFILLSGLCYGIAIAFCVYGPFSDIPISQDFPTAVNDSLHHFYKSLHLAVILIGVGIFIYITYGVVCMLASTRWPAIIWFYIGVCAAVQCWVIYVSVYAFIASGQTRIMYISKDLEAQLEAGFTDWCNDPNSKYSFTNDKFKDVDGCPAPGSFSDPVTGCLPHLESCTNGMLTKIVNQQRYIGMLGLALFGLGLLFMILAIHHKYRGIARLGSTTQPKTRTSGDIDLESVTASHFTRMHDEMEKESLLMEVRKREWERKELLELRSEKNLHQVVFSLVT